jgi:hypothetical protein
MVKDEGIDVISWWPEPDNRVGRGFVVGQVASGNDWVKKSVKPMVDIFIKEWFIVAPASAPHPTIFVPFLVGNEGHFRRVSISHGYVIDRLRLPPLAARAAELLRGGVVPIERTGELPAITAWINTHKSSLAEHRD